MQTKDFSKAKNIIENTRKALIVSHANPDPDAIGSMLVVKQIVEKLGKKAVVYCASGAPDYLNFLPDFTKIKKIADYREVNLIIGVDYGSFSRLGLNAEEVAKLPFLTFDHHVINDQRGLLLIDQKVSSTCEILYHFLNFLEIEINKDLATCLLAGIYEDTGGFRHPNTGSETLKISGELLLKGASFSKIIKNIYKADLPEAFKIWALGINKVVFDKDLGIVYSFIPNKDFLTLGKEIENLPDLPHFLSTVPEAKIAVLMIEKELGLIKTNLRSQKGRGVDVARVASFFGGRGLKLSSGFLSSETPEQIIEKIKSILLQIQKEAIKNVKINSDLTQIVV